MQKDWHLLQQPSFVVVVTFVAVRAGVLSIAAAAAAVVEVVAV